MINLKLLHCRPDLQAQKQAMIISSSENRTKLQQVEARILETLSYTKGNILENETAVDVLETAKVCNMRNIHSYCFKL